VKERKKTILNIAWLAKNGCLGLCVGKCVCLRERERRRKCVWERELGRSGEKLWGSRLKIERESVCVHACVRVCVYVSARDSAVG